MKDINSLTNIKDISFKELEKYDIHVLDFEAHDIEFELINFKNVDVKRKLLDKLDKCYNEFVKTNNLYVTGLAKIFKDNNLINNYLSLCYIFDVTYLEDKNYNDVENYLGWLETYICKHYY